jgi:hypothetical protein
MRTVKEGATEFRAFLYLFVCMHKGSHGVAFEPGRAAFGCSGAPLE